MNDIKSFTKICEVSEGQSLISTLGNLSGKFDKRTFEEIRQFVEKNYLLGEATSYGNTDRTTTRHVQSVVRNLVELTVEKEQKELLDRQIEIDQQMKTIMCEARNRKRKLFEERENIEKRIRLNDADVGIEAVFQAVNVENNMTQQKTTRIKQEKDFTLPVSGNIFSSPVHQTPDASHQSSPRNCSSSDSSFISCVSSQKSDDLNQSSSSTSMNTSTSDITGYSLRNNRKRYESVPNINCRRSNSKMELKTKNDEIFGFRKSKRAFSCAKCDYKTNNCADLQKHSTFSHGIGKAVKCEVCGRTYVRLDKFQKHKTTHPAQKSQNT